MQFDRTKLVRLLLIDDSAADVRLTHEALREAKVNLQISVARDGLEALDFLYKRNGFDGASTPDLIFLDLNLPRKGGIAVLEEIKKDEKLRSIPVVVFSTSSAHEDIFNSYQAHANCYISKPLDMEQFIDMIQTISKFWFDIVSLPKLAEENSR